MIDLLFYLIVRLHTFVTSWYKPFYESFNIWKSVMFSEKYSTLFWGEEYSSLFWQNISFFHYFDEDFFDWYKNDDFVLSLWEMLER